jgi:hypothetical protein
LKERNYVTIKGGSRGTPATAQKERKNWPINWLPGRRMHTATPIY